MTENDLELLDFRVIDLTSHIDPGVGAELSLSTKSGISARTPEPCLVIEFDAALKVEDVEIEMVEGEHIRLFSRHSAALRSSGVMPIAVVSSRMAR